MPGEQPPSTPSDQRPPGSLRPAFRLARFRRYRRRFRPLLLALIVGFVIVEIVVLFPGSLEETPRGTSTPVDPESLTASGKGEAVLASGIPRNRIPEYSVTDFDYVSTQDGEKQWKLLASKAALYNRERIVHARAIRAFLYDPQGEATLITGREAKYFMNQKDLEVFGDVVTTFPDGFELHSDYLRYRPQLRLIEIPDTYSVQGTNKEEKGQRMSFRSRGFEFSMLESRIVLPKSVEMMMRRRDPRDNTAIESDHCVIDRKKHLAHFTMDAHRPLSTRYVRISQPSLFARSRSADLSYGDTQEPLHSLVARDDVMIRQLPPKTAGASPTPGAPLVGDRPSELKYATGGQADFDNVHNLIVLTKFPQAYQGNDTVTGDVILMHRDSDIIEVEHSNSFSQGGPTN
jgi:LPS export ABC transporter protein LptC